METFSSFFSYLFRYINFNGNFDYIPFKESLTKCKNALDEYMITLTEYNHIPLIYNGSWRPENIVQFKAEDILIVLKAEVNAIICMFFYLCFIFGIACIKIKLKKIIKYGFEITK